MKIIFIFLICLLLFSFVSSESPNLLDGTQGLPSLDTASLSNNTYNINYTGITNVNNNTIYTNDSFIGNYSTFLTHITWANAVNGTLLSQATYNTN
jgi:hypothetical protein